MTTRTTLGTIATNDSAIVAASETAFTVVVDSLSASVAVKVTVDKSVVDESVVENSDVVGVVVVPSTGVDV